MMYIWATSHVHSTYTCDGQFLHTYAASRLLHIYTPTYPPEVTTTLYTSGLLHIYTTAYTLEMDNFFIHTQLAGCFIYTQPHTHPRWQLLYNILMGYFICTPPHTHQRLRLVGSLKLQVSFAKEPYEGDDILQKRCSAKESSYIYN